MQVHVTVIGGGAIGLSIAYALLQRGHSVRVLERGEIGREASWAGAGILAPAHAEHSLHPLDRLAGLGSRLHQEWAEQIRSSTGIDVGFRNCGGLYLARTAGEAAALRGQAESWEAEQIPVERWSVEVLRQRFAGRVEAAEHFREVIWTPAESQIRNPHFMRGLLSAIRLAGGEVLDQLGELQLLPGGQRVNQIQTSSGWRGECELLCVAAGAWTGQLLRPLGIDLPVEPIRGQMVLFRTGEPFPAIVNEGSRYLVPRTDGHLLAGSTMEQAGFDRSTTAEEIEQLISFARGLLPELRSASIVKQWAGLRPASYDGFPYLGWIPDWENVLVSTGHLRSGLQLAPASARLLADLIAGKGDPELLRLLSPARLGRSLES